MKKASLNLSIQMIVVVVIAFVVLGLGLGFVRTQFKSIGETTSAVQEQIKQQILDDLRTGTKKLSFPANEVKLSRSESSVTAFGVKNNDPGNLDFTIDVVALEGGQQVIAADGFLVTREVETLGPAESRVIPLRITAGTDTGTGQYKIQILYADGTKYDSKNFFITVQG